jgi:hypothetical protein
MVSDTERRAQPMIECRARLFTWLQQNEGGLNRSAGRYFAVERAA